MAMTKTLTNTNDNSGVPSKSQDPGSSHANQNSFNEMYAVLVTLRNFLSCYKCGKLASDAVELPSSKSNEEAKEKKDADGSDEEIQENGTANSISAQLVICVSCSESFRYEPHVQIRTLVQCYVKLCQYLKHTGFCNRNASGFACSRAQRDLTQLILDGAGFQDSNDVSAESSLLSRILSKPSNSGKRSLEDDGASPSKRKSSKGGKYRPSKTAGGFESNGGSDRKFCQCGHSTPRAGVPLTCLGQRCPCYSNGLGCYNCKCRGCKNPKKRSGENELLNNVNLYSTSSSTTSSTISSSCSSSPQPQEEPL